MDQTQKRKLGTWQSTAIYVNDITKGDDVALLNRAAPHLLKNEQTKLMKVVHVYDREEDIPTDLAEHLKTIDRLYDRLSRRAGGVLPRTDRESFTATRRTQELHVHRHAR